MHVKRIMGHASWVWSDRAYGLCAEVMDSIKESHLEKDGGNSSSALTAALGSSPSVNGT